MAWFKDLKVGSKLLLSFVVILIIAVFVGVYLLVQLRAIDDDYSAAMIVSEKRITLIFEAKDSFAAARVALREIYYPENTEDDLRRLSKQLDDELALVIGNFLELKNIAQGPVQAVIDTALPQAEQYRKDGKGIIDSLLAAGIVNIDDDHYRDAMIAGQEEIIRMNRDYADEMSSSILHISDLALKVFHEMIETNGARADSAFLISIILLVFMAAAALGIALFIPGLISKPLMPLMAFMKRASSTGDLSLSPDDVAVIANYAKVKDEIGQVIGACAGFVERVTEISKELETIAGGDLTAEIKMLSGKDTMGGSMSRMVDNLNNMFGEIHNATAQVSTGSKQIADGAQALAQGSTQQAASVQQLSASIGEIASKTKDNAELAERAATLADTIKNNAEKGSRQMDEMMAAVKEINSASQSINKVIKVIDDIAFQTNILALNAAVEAARAGQHGKGFAVVAEEVRNLAAKSAEAAKDTGGLIANSMEKAELGSRIASETADSLSEIVSGINQSNQIVGEIAVSSNEQTLGIMQINTGIDQVALVIQQNSATAQESAAASEQMSSQSGMLEEMVSQFKLREKRAKYLEMELPRAAAPRYGSMPSSGVSSSGDFGKY